MFEIETWFNAWVERNEKILFSNYPEVMVSWPGHGKDGYRFWLVDYNTMRNGLWMYVVEG